MLSVLVYRAASWTTYRRNADRVSALHTGSLSAILGFSYWEDKITNEQPLTISNL